MNDISLMNQIVGRAGMVFGPSVGAIMSRNRSAANVRARHSVMYVLSCEFGQTHSAIASYFGMNHASVCHAVKSVLRRLESNSEEATVLKDRLKKIAKLDIPQETPALENKETNGTHQKAELVDMREIVLLEILELIREMRGIVREKSGQETMHGSAKRKRAGKKR